MLGREFLEPIEVDSPPHPADRPHQVMLRFVIGDDGPRVSSDLLREIVFHKGTHIGMLQHEILERLAHVAYLSTVSMPRNKERERVIWGGGDAPL